MQSKMRVAIVGCGEHMYDTFYGALRTAPEHTVVAAADMNKTRLDKFCAFYNVPRSYADYVEMFDKERPDVVIAAVGHDEHPRIAAEAMKHGAHILTEKTPCVTSRQAEELADIQAKTGKWTMVGFAKRFIPAFVMANEIIHRPEFGGVQMYQSQVHGKPYRDEEFYKINHVIHHLDLARALLGEISLTHVQRVGLNVNMVGFSISFTTEQGAIGTIHSGSFLDESYGTERLELLGVQRNVVVEHYRHLIYNRPVSESQSETEAYELRDGENALVWNQSHRWDPKTNFRGFDREIPYFFNCVSSNTRPFPDIEDSAKTMQLYESMQEMLGIRAG